MTKALPPLSTSRVSLPRDFPICACVQRCKLQRTTTTLADEEGGLAIPRCDLPVRATGIFRPRIPLRVWQSITTSLPPDPSDLPTLPTCSPCPFLTCIPSLLVKSRKRGGTVPSPRTPLALAGQIQHARKRDLPNLPFNVPCPKIDGIQCIGSWRRWFPWRIGTWVERSPEPDK